MCLHSLPFKVSTQLKQPTHLQVLLASPLEPLGETQNVFFFHSGGVPPIGTNVGSVSLTVYLNYIKDRQLKAGSSESFPGKKICKTQADCTTCNHGFENTEAKMSC